jgi:hypothetical protein
MRTRKDNNNNKKKIFKSFNNVFVDGNISIFTAGKRRRPRRRHSISKNVSNAYEIYSLKKNNNKMIETSTKERTK